jgi:hypothetical protein
MLREVKFVVSISGYTYLKLVWMHRGPLFIKINSLEG